MCRPTSPSRRKPAPPSTTPLHRLPKINYSLLKEIALKKKLGELGIPNWGAKALLIRRHTEWVNLWNANCDSSQPRSRRDLLRELDMWERAQGGHAPTHGGHSNSGNAVMRKDFNAAEWAANHNSDFRELISSARATQNGPTSVADVPAGGREASAGPPSSPSEDDLPEPPRARAYGQAIGPLSCQPPSPRNQSLELYSSIPDN